MKTKSILSLLLLFLALSSFTQRKNSKWSPSGPQPDLTIVGNVDMTDGMGRQSAELIHAFKNELNINFLPTRQGSHKDVPSGIGHILTRKFSQYGKVVLLEEVLWDPNIPFSKLHIAPADRKKSILISYSMFESDKVLPQWVKALNTYFDAVAVPDPYLIDVYRNSGVNIPIFSLPLGLHLDHYLEKPLKNKKNSPFVFGYFSFLYGRKNQHKLIEAFAKAFKNNPNVQLKIHGRGYESPYEEKVTGLIRKLRLKNISYHIGRLSKEKYLDLFCSIDCYVSTSKGEGYSIQPREAMALGIPVIATDCTAQSTICNSGLIRSIPSNIPVPARYNWAGTFCGNQFDSNVADIADALRDVYYNYEKYLEKSAQARAWAKSYSYDNLRPRYRNLIKPKKIILGDKNEITDEYLMTNSVELYEKYLRIISSET